MNSKKIAKKLRSLADKVEATNLFYEFPEARELHVAIEYTAKEDGSAPFIVATATVPVDGDKVVLDLTAVTPPEATFIRSIHLAARS